MRVSYHINAGVVTHGHVAISTHQQFACLKAIDRAWGRCQRHRLEDGWVVAHDRDAANLKPQSTLFLWGAKQASVFTAIALRVLLHGPLGTAEDADLKSVLSRDQAAVIASATHDRWRCSSRNRGGERGRSSTIVVLRLGV